MTARDRLGLHVRRARIILSCGVTVVLGTVVALFAIEARVPRNTRPPEWTGFVFVGGCMLGALTMGAAGLYAYSTMRCPWCGGDLAAFAYQRWFSGSQVRFCLRCGKSLDDKLPAASEPGKSSSRSGSWEDELA